MRRSRISTALGIVVATAVVITGTTGFTPPPVDSDSSDVSISTEVVDASTALVTIDLPLDSGVDGTTEVRVVDDLPVEIDIDVTDTQGEETQDSLVIESIEVTTPEAFVATVRSETTGETITVDTTVAEQQVIPAIIAALVVTGIKAALKIGTKVALKEAAKKALLALDANKWAHIQHAKHNWSRLAKNKDEIADLMADAMANGSRSVSTNHVDFTWTHRGQTIVVRTSLDGKISNGWIK